VSGENRSYQDELLAYPEGFDPIVLRCGNCGTQFDITSIEDLPPNGFFPLWWVKAHCPGCNNDVALAVNAGNP
jgi:hypothetical protein